MRARAVVLASGCFEQPAVFGNNDLPGVMLATAVQRLIHRFAVKPFDRAVVLTANADGYRVALDLHAAGIDVEAVVDLRPASELGTMPKPSSAPGSPYAGHAVLRRSPTAASGTDAVEVAPARRAGPTDCRQVVLDPVRRHRDERRMGGGRRSLLPGRRAHGLVRPAPAIRPQSRARGLFAAGRLNGVYALDEQMQDGRRAGLAAAAFLGRQRGRLPAAGRAPAASPTHPYPIFPSPPPRASSTSMRTCNTRTSSTRRRKGSTTSS